MLYILYGKYIGVTTSLMQKDNLVISMQLFHMDTHVGYGFTMVLPICNDRSPGLKTEWKPWILFIVITP